MIKFTAFRAAELTKSAGPVIELPGRCRSKGLSQMSASCREWRTRLRSWTRVPAPSQQNMENMECKIQWVLIWTVGLITERQSRLCLHQCEGWLNWLSCTLNWLLELSAATTDLATGIDNIWFLRTNFDHSVLEVINDFISYNATQLKAVQIWKENVYRKPFPIKSQRGKSVAIAPWSPIQKIKFEMYLHLLLQCITFAFWAFHTAFQSNRPKTLLSGKRMYVMWDGLPQGMRHSTKSLIWIGADLIQDKGRWTDGATKHRRRVAKETGCQRRTYWLRLRRYVSQKRYT